MNWLRNKPVIQEKKMEPGATFSAFEQHWAQAVQVMGSSEDSEATLTVISYLTQMISLLRVARGEDPEQSCKTFWIQNQCSDKVLQWIHDLKNKGLLLSREDDERLVMMLHALCELASRDGEILGYVRSNNEMGAVPWDGASSLAGLLLEYSLGTDITLSETSKHSFILLIKLASRFPALEKSLSQDNGIGYTNLVISGLCACFAQLPTTYHGSSEQIRPFIQQLKFVDDIAYAAPTKVAMAIAECFRHSFLDAIIKPALLQDEGNRSLHKRHDPYVTVSRKDDHPSLCFPNALTSEYYSMACTGVDVQVLNLSKSVYEEEAVVTRYLQTMCELVTQPLLVQRLVHFIISMLQPAFLQRMNHANVSVTVSTLNLLNSVLHFYCEDFWFEAVLKYLLPQNHRMVLQRKTAIAEVDFQDSSVRFLALIPACIIDAIGPDHLTHHYVQYLNSESRRLSNLDAIGLGFLTPKVSSIESEVNASTKSIVNPLYPNWKLKYDGTDEVKPPEIIVAKAVDPSNSNATTPEAALPVVNGHHHGGIDSAVDSQNVASEEQKSVTAEKFHDPLDAVGECASEFTNISLQPPIASDEMSSIGLSEQSYDSLGSSDPLSDDKRIGGVGATVSPLSSDGYGSMTHQTDLVNVNSFSNKIVDNPASFGPFLDCLLQHLANWTQLDPDVILMVSELLSTVAASRIPLVSSLFLDPTLILQPSYVSFASLLNRIRSELDASLRHHPTVLQEVWNTMSRDRRNSTSSISSVSSNFDSESIGSTGSFTDNIWKKMQSSRFSLFGRSSVSLGSSHHPSGNSSDTQEVLQAVGGGQGYRYTNSPLTSPPQGDPMEPVKLMASRAIFFSHWLLELAAISQQLCWKMV